MKRFKVPQALCTTESEYRANVTGINIFFGAVLGFVISDVSAPDDIAFALFLGMSATIVISILYLSASHNRLVYVPLTFAMIYFFPEVVHEDVKFDSRYQVTLYVWATMTALLELYPRRPDPQPKGRAHAVSAFEGT
jgi:hypothetical protein